MEKISCPKTLFGQPILPNFQDLVIHVKGQREGQTDIIQYGKVFVCMGESLTFPKS